MAGKPAYLSRLTCLFAINAMVAPLDSKVLSQDLLTAVIKLAGDKVPNIRFNAARVLGAIAAKADASVVSSKIKPVLSKLASDEDPDVKFFAQQASA
jgi:serine/threonine-protein phosphatase 2A regulatory subunit A